MRPVAEPDAFRAAPLGRYCAGPCWVVWCWDESLCGSIVWGRPSEAEARALVRMFDIEAALTPPFDVVTDSSRMELVSPAAFAVVAEYLRRRLPVLVPLIRKNALVAPPGLIGAAIAGLYPLLGLAPSWKPVTTMGEALRWFETDSARAAGP